MTLRAAILPRSDACRAGLWADIGFQIETIIDFEILYFFYFSEDELYSARETLYKSKSTDVFFHKDQLAWNGLVFCT